jgi:glycosyltransferase involved in cell wall biosynthesis
MVIGIDASRAFLHRRTGIEEYSYQVIRHLRDVIQKEDCVVLYVCKKLEIENWKLKITNPPVDFPLPSNWKIRALWAPRFWTQFRLSLEMLFHRPDVLFVPAHVVPVIHPKKTVVTVHGLEYEMFPEAYSFWERLYMRLSIRFSVRVASRVVAVSENTKRDLMRLYGVPEEKISVVYEGVSENNFQFPISPAAAGPRQGDGNFRTISKSQFSKPKNPHLLFIGRLEERKNIVRIIEAFEILKEKYHIPHVLVLAGKPGYGHERIKNQKSKIKNQDLVFELGYVSEEEKFELLKNADVFLFPTLYEGFGLPVLEAQAFGVPIVMSDTSSLPEVGGEGAAYADPLSASDIAEKTWRILSEKDSRSAIIAAGRENVRRFSWRKCSEEIARLLRK